MIKDIFIEMVAIFAAILVVGFWIGYLLNSSPFREHKELLPQNHPDDKMCGRELCENIKCQIRADQFKAFSNSRNPDDLIQDEKPEYYIWM